MHSMRQLLESLFANKPALAKKIRQHALWPRWAEVAGSHIAAHAQPHRVQGTTLVLVVANSVWMQELTYLKGELLDKIQAAVGAELITDVRLELRRP